MTKQIFLQELEQELQGNLSAQKIQENIQYYDSYIEEQKAAGKTEQEVLEMLGDARLIAQSILAASEADEQDPFYERSYAEDMYREDGTKDRNHLGQIDFSKWYWKLAACLIVILVAAIVISIVIGLIKIVLYLAIPVLAVVAVIALVEYLKDRRL